MRSINKSCVQQGQGHVTIAYLCICGICYFVAKPHGVGYFKLSYCKSYECIQKPKSGCLRGWLSDTNTFLALCLVLFRVASLSLCLCRIITCSWILTDPCAHSIFIHLYPASSNRDYSSWANARPWCLLQLCHAPVATRFVWFDGLLWGPLWSTSDGRSRRWWRRWNWDQSQHRW